MPRWEPGAATRLRDAAMDLFAERGYEQVTVADIVARAALTRRTFFRHFPDKREVLYAGSHRLPEEVERLLDAAEPPADAVLRVLVRAGEALLASPGEQRRRQAIIDASEELRERERSKQADLASAISRPLARRGMPVEDAELTGALMTAVFASAYGRALQDDAGTFAARMHEAVGVLAACARAPE